MILADLITFLEKLAPTHYQENYDNSGLLLGDPEKTITRALIAVDVTEAVIEEAIQNKCDLIVSHHPLIFKGLKRLTGSTYVERLVIKAIQYNLAIYAIHTNLDNVQAGINRILGQKLGLDKLRILAPKKDLLCKLVTFCPIKDAEHVRKALFEEGAGRIGEYDSCSFNLEGTGSFRGSEDSDPHVGEKGKLHYEPEVRIETILPRYLEKRVVNALITAHPYEEVAYDIYPLGNEFTAVGSGMIGELQKEMDELDFLQTVKKAVGASCIRYSQPTGQKIKKVAFCGGSGSFLIQEAKRQKAQAFITGDLKYHDFFEGEQSLLIADVGHYESEQFAKELIGAEITKNFSNFAVLISEAGRNAVNYL
jgi:dinuclear metal center YbgI/SA1388 family protein